LETTTLFQAYQIGWVSFLIDRQRDNASVAEDIPVRRGARFGANAARLRAFSGCNKARAAHGFHETGGSLLPGRDRVGGHPLQASQLKVSYMLRVKQPIMARKLRNRGAAVSHAQRRIAAVPRLRSKKAKAVKLSVAFSVLSRALARGWSIFQVALLLKGNVGSRPPDASERRAALCQL